MCTVGQSSIAGESTRVSADGVIRGWAVRNSSGDLSLQVIGFRGGRAFLRSFSQVESADDLAPHVFETAIRVERGDLVALLLAPGASVGARTGTPETAALRWSGSLPYAPERLDPIRLREELLLRVDIEPGARLRLPQLQGGRAEVAPEGTSLGSETSQAPGGRPVRVELVRLDDVLAIDSFRGGRRLARAVVEGARPEGRALSFQVQCGYHYGFCVRWQNEGEDEPVIHAYRLTSEGLFRQIG